MAELFTQGACLLYGRSLIQRLEKVDPVKMTHEEQLCFWINIHNALVMHVLPYTQKFQSQTVPWLASPCMIFLLLQNASLNLYCFAAL